VKKRKSKSLVLSGNGINCELETAHANRLVGFDTDIIHINSLLDGSKSIHEYQFLNFPGGFLDGDDLGSAKAQAVKWKYQKVHVKRAAQTIDKPFLDELIRFVADGKIIIGICNGFQLLVKTGLLPGLGSQYGEQSVTLTFNDSGRFQDRWVYLCVHQLSSCIFTKDMDKIYLPVRHGEGKLVTKTEKTLQQLRDDGHIVMQYADDNGRVTAEFPWNPNGSADSIAALCDPSGRIFGLMPHPEAFVHYTQHPHWTREHLPEEGEGLTIFKNAYHYVVDNL
jgi:phosphoribosylformylglycinamidine synthase subunit PurQ / glutaminase